MSKSVCKCGNVLWDGDGKISYDIYKMSDLKEYAENNIDGIYSDFYYGISPDKFFERGWYCDNCHRVKVWFDEELLPQLGFRCYEKLEIDDSDKDIDIKKLEEIFIHHIYDYDELDDYKVKDIVDNGYKNRRWFIDRDYVTVYLYDIKRKCLISKWKMENANEYRINRFRINSHYENKAPNILNDQEISKNNKKNNSLINESKKENFIKKFINKLFSKVSSEKVLEKKKYFYVQVEYCALETYKWYSYLCDDSTVSEMDYVVVDMNGRDVLAKVMIAKWYAEDEVPYPVQRTKKVKQVFKYTEPDDFDDEDESDEEFLRCFEPEFRSWYEACYKTNNTISEENHEATTTSNYVGMNDVIEEDEEIITDKKTRRLTLKQKEILKKYNIEIREFMKVSDLLEDITDEMMLHLDADGEPLDEFLELEALHDEIYYNE